MCECICVAEYFSQLEIAYAILYVERFTKPLWSLFDPRALFVFTSYAFNVWGKMVERQVCSWNELNEVHFKPAKLTFTGVLHVVQKPIHATVVATWMMSGARRTLTYISTHSLSCVDSVVVHVRVCRPHTHLTRYLVDPASSHMLVSKIKPCMSKYKPSYTVKLRMAH